MTRRVLTIVAWAFPVLSSALVVTMLVIDPGGSIGTSVVGSAAPVAFAVTGAVIASRRPRNGIAWLLCFFSLTIPAEEVLGEVAKSGLSVDSPLAWLVWTTAWMWAPMLVALLIYLPLTFPHGRIRGRATAVVLAVAGFGVTLVVVGNALTPSVPAQGWINPIALHGHDELLALLTGVGSAPVGVALIAAMVLLVRRYRRSTGEERQQLKWLVFSVSLAVAGAVGNGIAYETGNAELGQLFVGAGLLWLPIGIGVGILRHRLYDIDRLVSRTVGYGLVTAIVVAVYLAAVTSLTALTSPVTGHSPAAVAAATLIAASIFQPLRRRIQHAVDRRFNRARYDVARAVDSYRGRLRDELDLEAIAVGLLETAQSTLEPSTAAVWFQPREVAR